MGIILICTINIIQASITWKRCVGLQTGLGHAKITVINGKVYCGGDTNTEDNKYIVYCYDPSEDKWTTLPPLPVKRFGLGQVNGKLVAVGGQKESNDITNEVYTYDKQLRKWRQTIPPMPTARCSTGVLSLQSALVVAGGLLYTAAVEIFKPDTLQWYRTDPLPTACCLISLVAIGNTCYGLGGYKYPSHLNQALCASVDDLRNAVPANQTTHSGSSDTQSAWKTLPNTSTPTYEPAATVLAGNLLAIGGKETAKGGAPKKEVYMYSPATNSWIYISDLPAPRLGAAVTVLSSTEILVIGGKDDGGYVNTVYKGTLHLQQR